MYNSTTLKDIYRKAKRTKKQLKSSLDVCNTTYYTEQNEEELNAVKTYIGYKLDLICDMLEIIAQFIKSKDFRYEEISTDIDSFINQYNALAQDPYLSRLEKIYTRKTTIEECLL